MQNPYQQYANNQVNTAPPEELTLMLYKGAIKFIRVAIQALSEKKLEEAHKNIIKTEEIYLELMATLDHKYPIANELEKLYDFIIYLLKEANVSKDQKLLKQALDMSREFAETWEQAIKIYRQGQSKKAAKTG